jgi:hypothetical protein
MARGRGKPRSEGWYRERNELHAPAGMVGAASIGGRCGEEESV